MTTCNNHNNNKINSYNNKNYNNNNNFCVKSWDVKLKNSNKVKNSWVKVNDCLN